MDTKTTLIIGGCRSGKSSMAIDLANRYGASEKKIFIATCVPLDTEMQDRVQKHKDERDNLWQTLEIPINLSQAIRENSPNADVILIDCITLWVNNLLMETSDNKTISDNIQDLVSALDAACCPVILVSNEVGTGIVPENALARLFRDYAGFANQQIAKHVQKVIWMVAGIPVTIKAPS
jgi:adenosylcobinamide kinase/adenosylcobinamide-phosphate guanylyltransferase